MLAPQPRPRGGAHVGEMEHHLHDGPQAQEHDRGPEESLEPATDERPGRLALAARGVVGDEVREAADEEEDRHDLEDPGEEPQART